MNYEKLQLLEYSLDIFEEIQKSKHGNELNLQFVLKKGNTIFTANTYEKTTAPKFPNATFPVRKSFINNSISHEVPDTLNTDDTYTKVRLLTFQHFEIDSLDWENNLEYLVIVLKKIIETVELPKIDDKLYYNYQELAPYSYQLPWVRENDDNSSLEIISLREQS